MFSSSLADFNGTQALHRLESLVLLMGVYLAMESLRQGLYYEFGGVVNGRYWAIRKPTQKEAG